MFSFGDRQSISLFLMTCLIWLMMVQRVRFLPWKVMMGDASKETGKVPIGKNPSSAFTISRLCQDNKIGNVSDVVRRRMKKNKKGKTRILLPSKSFIFHVSILSP